MFALFARGAKFRFILPKNPAHSKHCINTLAMLYLIGLGLGDETDITVKGLAIVRKATRVYLEAYTSILLVDKDVLVCILTPRRRPS